MTNSLLRFTAKRPFISALLALFLWLALSAVGVVVAMTLLDRPIGDNVVQSAGSLFGVACLLALVWRLGWLKAVGTTRLGGRGLWLLTAALAIYTVITYQLAFIGKIGFSLDQLSSDAGREILWRQAVVGFVEETLFRGILLYILVRVWGGRRRGQFAAVAVTALLFGLLHSLQALSGSETWQVALTILISITSGLWMGALVLWGGSIWPVALLHGLGNAAVQLPLVNTADNITARGFALATLTELALVVLCWALLLRDGAHAPDSRR